MQRIAQVEDIQQVRNQLKEKLQNLEDRSRRDEMKYQKNEEQSWNDTEKLLKDVLPEKLGVTKIQIEKTHRVGAKEVGKDIKKFSSYKGKQLILNKATFQKREDIYVYDDFSKATVAIRKENWEKVTALRQQGKYVILIYDKIYSRHNLYANNLLQLRLTGKKSKN